MYTAKFVGGWDDKMGLESYLRPATERMLGLENARGRARAREYNEILNPIRVRDVEKLGKKRERKRVEEMERVERERNRRFEEVRRARGGLLR